MPHRSANPFGANEVRKGLVHFATGKSVQLIAGVATMLVLVRWMDVAQYAAYVTTTAAASVVGTFSLLGMDRLVNRYLPEARLKSDPSDFRKFLRLLMVARLAAVCVAALILMAAWSSFAELVGLGKMGSLRAPLVVYSIVHAACLFETSVVQALMLQRALRNSVSVAAVAKLGALLTPITLGYALTAEYSLWIACATELMTTLWLVNAASKTTFGAREATGEYWKPSPTALGKFAAMNFIAGQAAFPTQTRVLQLVAAATMPTTTVAAFGFISTLTDQIRQYLPLNLFRNLIEPVMIGRHLQRDDTSHLNLMASAVLKINALVVLPLSVWFFFESREILSLLSKGKFGPESWMLPVLTITMVFSVQRTIVVIQANATEKSGLLTVSSLIASAATVTLLWTQLSSFGALPLILSEATFSVIMVCLIVQFQKAKSIKSPLRANFALKVACATLATAGVAYLVNSVLADTNSIVRMTLAALSIAAVFYTIQFVWKPLTDGERQILQRIAGRIPIPF